MRGQNGYGVEPDDDAVPPPSRADLTVLLGELDRVRAAAPDDGLPPSAAEAITLASAAMRLVEAQLAARARGDSDNEDVDLSRDVLRAALDVLHAALAGMPDAPQNADRAPRLRRRARR